ncbi:hypothetical protein DFJ74DRAFT_660543 [Hyaloraphidium curvatum]|nr:hypothetical protein DFJ74DRAFT_660543 [Hyaloraphidium curvatum]
MVWPRWRRRLVLLGPFLLVAALLNLRAPARTSAPSLRIPWGAIGPTESYAAVDTARNWSWSESDRPIALRRPRTRGALHEFVRWTGDVATLLPRNPEASPSQLDFPLLPQTFVVDRTRFILELPNAIPGSEAPRPRGVAVIFQACHKYACALDFWILPPQRELVAFLLTLGFAVLSPDFIRFSRTNAAGCAYMAQEEPRWSSNPDYLSLRESLPKALARSGLAGLPLFWYAISGIAGTAALLFRDIQFAAAVIHSGNLPFSLLRDPKVRLPPVLHHMFLRDYYLPRALAENFTGIYAGRAEPTRVISDERWFGLTTGDELHRACPEVASRDEWKSLLAWMCSRGRCARHKSRPLSTDSTLAMDDYVDPLPNMAGPGPIAGSRFDFASEDRLVVHLPIEKKEGWFDNLEGWFELFDRSAVRYYRRLAVLDLLAFAATAQEGKGEGAKAIWARVRAATAADGGPYVECASGAELECRVLRADLDPRFYDRLVNDTELAQPMIRKARIAHKVAIGFCITFARYVHQGLAGYGGKQEMGAWFERWLDP